VINGADRSASNAQHLPADTRVKAYTALLDNCWGTATDGRAVAEQAVPVTPPAVGLACGI